MKAMLPRLRAWPLGAAWLVLGGSGCGGKTPTDLPRERPSCAALDPRACQGESCCSALRVPAQRFTLGGNVETPTAAASVSAFSLDEYEVTVGRFRAFLADYDAWRRAGNPRVSAGEHPLIPGSGWQADWLLPASAEELTGRAGVQCSTLTQTFTAGSEQRPINCVSWLEAFAFCIWDGARLPTESEWEAAATGGDEGRPFPWGRTAPDVTRAAYDCTGDGSAAQDCAVTDILDVGSKPAGAGRFGHQDLAGNVWEWVFDYYAAYPKVATDYANTDGKYRTIRGSGWYSAAEDLRAPIRYNSASDARRSDFGFRCAASD